MSTTTELMRFACEFPDLPIDEQSQFWNILEPCTVQSGTAAFQTPSRMNF
jgi:hypothetical protein